ncbi:phosphoglycerate mutase family protein GPM3 Ecym_5246 [Eremothecium cymbalariae DBVPG|uniref:Phosphoglycerate mutase n=1 Tax=Eremothecium cymbalariae (strain CBS 270.75 / DBVPG 7215 / KCTC 17166 / NRRL Y-17582) TaxID=931890 RepID=I6ND71_ERECY|nr:hypothetical protein Ecym_5246 [Eremothecium cymbalariae DBVPG\
MPGHKVSFMHKLSMTNSGTFKLFVLRHGQSELNHENIFCGWIDAHLTEMGKRQASNSASLIKAYCQQHNISLPKIGYTSRLVRTQETMEVMMKTLGLDACFHVTTALLDAQEHVRKASSANMIPILQTWRLNERHYGSWQGLRKPEVLEQYGKDEYNFIRRNYYGRPPDVDLSKEMVQENDEQGPVTGYHFKEPNRKLKYTEETAERIQFPQSESLCDVVRRLTPFLVEIILRFAKQYGGSAIVVGHGSSVRSILKVLQNLSDDEIKDVEIPNGVPLLLELDLQDNSVVKHFYLDPELAKDEGKRRESRVTKE